MTALRLYHWTPSADLTNARVSDESFWCDDEWQFETETSGAHRGQYKINWRFELRNGEMLTDPQFAKLLESWKRIIWCLFTEPGDGLTRKFVNCSKISTGMRTFVKWCVSKNCESPSEITASMVGEYMAYLAETFGSADTAGVLDDEDHDLWEDDCLTSLALTAYVWPPVFLYWARNALAAAGFKLALSADPLNGLSVISMARIISKKATQAIPEIPDQVYVPIVNAAFLMMMAPWTEPLIEFNNKIAERRLRHDRKTVTSKKPHELEHKALCEAFVRSWFDNVEGERAPDVVRRAIRNLRVACAMLIQATTGLRISEICGLPCGKIDGESGVPECIEVVRSFDDEYEMFYLHGNLYKTTKSSERVRWVVGMRPTGSDYFPPAVLAVRVLARLDAGWRLMASENHLCINFSNSVGMSYTAENVTGYLAQSLRRSQKEWIAEFGNVPERERQRRISTHMWRKTFARYMIRTNRNLLPAIQHHFKHLSHAMTERGYCHDDSTAAQIIEDARVQEAGNLIYGIVTGERSVAGPVAEEVHDYAKKLRSRLGNRRENDVRKDIRESVLDRNFQLYGMDYGWCVFRGDSARCHLLAGQPVLGLLRLAPAFKHRSAEICRGCVNFAVSPEHRPFWEQRLRDNEEKLRALSLPNGCPGFGSVIERRVQQCRTVLAWLDEADDAA